MRYTLNRHGAFKGWSPILSQPDFSMFTTKTDFKNLYLTGHWVSTVVGEAGVPQAAYTGYRVAQSIIKKEF